ncbi:MAG: hypothetical protein D8M58_00295 [Calditrichaeota bacterium]|nr:MAG: hypothetical protein DWQ03_06785 [Calditrichota bacterium]MBL1203809.1 hypothetical protein [Calditrichota bacterium]NOG43639.1 hypothetical protein [Calditrichota bacterium]
MGKSITIILLSLFVSNSFANTTGRQVRQVRDGSSVIGVGILKGDKVKDGFTLHYLSLNRELDNDFESGFGFAINYFDVLNLDDGFKGTFFSYSPQFALNYYLNDGPVQIIIGGAAHLVFGSERINNQTSNFFIGPQLKETFGIKLADTICIKAGGFQLWHLGSEILPSDFGLTAGFDISF